MKITLVQHQPRSNYEDSVRRSLEAVREAAEAGCSLIVFPELAFQPFFPQKPRQDGFNPHAEPVPGPTTDRFCELAAELSIVTVINLYERDGDKTYDSSPVIDADGQLLGVARMIHIMDGPCFHERDYYAPGDRGAPVFDTQVGKVGVAICYDRHYPEYMRALGVKGAQLVVVPQAGGVGEWPDGVFEAELQVASLHNGYFAALANRVGKEECLTFAGQSYVTDPRGQVIARAPAGEETLLHVELDLSRLDDCPAKKHFMADRRPEVYPLW